jgi:predicted ABC-type ATPase
MKENKPKIVLIAGPNGAGKTTLSSYILRDKYEVMEYVNADTIALGLSAFQPEKVAFEAGRVMLKRLKSLAQQKTNFAFETTLASRSYSVWLSSLIKEGYEFHLLYIWLQSPDLALERVKERVRLGGHSIAPDVVYRRYYNGLRNFWQLYHSIATTWAIYDNSSLSKAELIAVGLQTAVINIYNLDLWDKLVYERDKNTR